MLFHFRLKVGVPSLSLSHSLCYGHIRKLCFLSLLAYIYVHVVEVMHEDIVAPSQVGSSGPPYGLLQGSLGSLDEVPPQEGGTVAK